MDTMFWHSEATFIFQKKRRKNKTLKTYIFIKVVKQDEAKDKTT
jgi:hypothetical protein